MDFLIALLKALLPWRLFHYTIVRAGYGATGFEGSPYYHAGMAGSTFALRIGMLFAIGIPVVARLFALWDLDGAAFGAIAASATAIVAYYLWLPSTAFPRTQLEPVISHRATAISRILYLAMVYAVLATLQLAGYQVWRYFLVLWILPLFSTFTLFMMLRQWLQHGNTDRGRYTNSRVYLLNPLLNYCLFPSGQEYHLTHHVQASVPHFNLKKLHEVLLNDPRVSRQRASGPWLLLQPSRHVGRRGDGT